MKDKEQTLSDKRKAKFDKAGGYWHYPEEDVKEFINRILKRCNENTQLSGDLLVIPIRQVEIIINEETGDKLK